MKRKKQYLLLAKATRDLRIPEADRGKISLTIYFSDQVRLIRKA